MAVALTIAETLGGAAVSDGLAGGGTGVDMGSVNNGEYTPIDTQSTNTGWQSLYISHDASIDEITSVKTFIAEYSQTYGGAAANAAADFTTLKAKGNASDANANNATGLGSGLRVEHDADLGATLGLSAFDASRAQVEIYGKSDNGIDLDSAFDLHVDALIQYNGGSPIDATSPETGKIGKSGDSTLGDVALIRLRYYLEDAALDGGIIQWDWIISYSFTA